MQARRCRRRTLGRPPRDRLLAQLTTADPATAQIASLREFLAEILALCPEHWSNDDRLPDYL